MNIKYKGVENCQIYCGLIFFSNEISPFRLDEGDRRFFVTRCDWTKNEADELKANGYFTKLIDFYKNPIHKYGLYLYLQKRQINTKMKGDAPPTSTKDSLIYSEPNETEQFFNDLKKHSCRYWTSRMIDDLYKTEVENKMNDYPDTRQFKHLKKQLIPIKPIKYADKSVRLLTFTLKEADVDNDLIRKNMDENWGKTTSTLFPSHNARSTGTSKIFELFKKENMSNEYPDDMVVCG